MTEVVMFDLNYFSIMQNNSFHVSSIIYALVFDECIKTFAKKVCSMKPKNPIEYPELSP